MLEASHFFLKLQLRSRDISDIVSGNLNVISSIPNQGCICDDHKQSTRSKSKASWNLSTMSCFQSWATICCTIAFWKSFENKNIFATYNGFTGKFEGKEGYFTKNVVYQEVLSIVHTTNNNPVVTILGGGGGIDLKISLLKITNNYNPKTKQHLSV